MRERLERVLSSAREEIERAADASQVEALRIRYLGKKGELSQVLGGMGKLPPEERRALGEVANRVKAELEALLVRAVARVEEAALGRELGATPLDVTLPGRQRPPGHRHLVSRTLDDVIQSFQRLGFEVFTGPEVEVDALNFEALNIPADHPARDMQDTFYVDAPWSRAPAGQVLLRTHTSPGQIRAMRSRPPPLRIVVPGKAYRVDSDATHTPMFHQIEGLLVDRGITFADLKGTLTAFVTSFFGADRRTRFRPSYFQFTEPSAEVDVSCGTCGGKGCRVCKQSGWLEILGSGMVHPAVLAAGGYDPAEVTGFAWGMGIERIAMLRHGLDDLRSLFENDMRFLEQF
ncbi:MAG TPA: phenylalanine--tRNA ligase subunit alpha [Myxococcaceae bacterium]|nr:phenylalanine--tRNA ligase subunit alpha [Myxococcaceae bacterium]